MARPLQKTTSDGALYTRFPAVEAAIDAALTQNPELWCRRARVRDRKSPDHLPTECLVYLIRESHRTGDADARDALLAILLERCRANLNSKVDGKIPNAVELREDILGNFAELFAVDGSAQDKHELDFFEVRFNMGFMRFRIDCVRDALARLNGEEPLPEVAGEAATIEQELDNEVLARLSDIQGTASSPEDRLFRKQVIAAIKVLPPDERNAVILCHYYGFKEESEDPTEQTAATLCGVTGRTIRNRLTRALAKLSKLKEDA